MAETHDQLEANVIAAAKETHRARVAYIPFMEHDNPLAFMDWRDTFLDRNVRLSVAVEKLERFESEVRCGVRRAS